jgi:hypothetical protein
VAISQNRSGQTKNTIAKADLSSFVVATCLTPDEIGNRPFSSNEERNSSLRFLLKYE